MNPNKLAIFGTLRARRNTRHGRIVIWGSLVQAPAALFMFWRAWASFPHAVTDEMLMAGLFHLAIPAVLAASFVQSGAELDFRPSSILTVYLVLIACMPFALSLPLMY